MAKKKLRLLACDPATSFGWAHSNGESGVFDLSVKPDESSCFRLIRLRTELTKLHARAPVDVMVYEAGRSGKFPRAIKVAGQIEGQLTVWATDAGIEYRAYSPGEIKKFATGSGSADKTAMEKAAKVKWPKIKFKSADEIDAKWLLELALSEYGELTITSQEQNDK